MRRGNEIFVIKLLSSISLFGILMSPSVSFWDVQTLETKPNDWEVTNSDNDRCLNTSYPKQNNNSRPLILVAGLSRTGTSSLQDALIALNLTVFHTYETVIHHLDFWYYYLNGYIEKPNIQAILDPLGIHAISDCWFAHLTPEIIKAYPNTKVILTTREAQAWIRSYRSYLKVSDLYHWSRQFHRLMASRISHLFHLGSILKYFNFIPNTNDGLDLEKLPMLMNIWAGVDRVVYGSNNPNPLWHNAYERHNAYIRAIVPKDQLFEFNLGNGDGWDQLIHFLGVDQDTARRVLSKPFPRLNCVATNSCVSQLSTQATRLHELFVLLFSLLLLAFLFFLYHQFTYDERENKISQSIR
uniref:Sulfotransferase domain-containing protein n=1 Tax=Aureoumbra lagunensis TaxID=44058 RepID=A0A7S3JUL4_9STRA|mmetsp:Transcript_15547/g.23403  ORF Transcript_15547/g.23403 Transcript_15547/m.23403 type:complete len:355 (+) Transcript_15547:125-1189(+)